MADRPPFGFGPPGRPGDNDPRPGGEGEGGQGPFGPFGPLGGPGGAGQFADALRQFADLLSYSGGPVNWELAKNLARHTIAAKGDPSVLANERAAITEAIRLADLWLDDVTTFPSGIRKIEAWSQSEWLEATFPVWSKLCEPIAVKGVDAMGSMLTVDPSQLGEGIPEEMRAALSGLGGLAGLAPMFRQLGGALIGGQTGTAIGELAGEMVSSTDIGIPLGPEGTAALLPSGVAAFGAGLSVDLNEVRLFLALREAAHHRLFGHVPWLRQHLFGAVEAYASGINVDMGRLRDAMPEIDINNPEALREALAGEALFRPEDTPQQKAALARLETALALVEGWVATVVSAAASTRLTHADALAEAIRRRRATGGPSERTFATLVGLELRPRMLREAAVLWEGLTAARGVEGRDALWAHPDLLPTAEDLENPDAFVRGQTELDISDLEDESGESDSGEAPPPGESSLPDEPRTLPDEPPEPRTLPDEPRTLPDEPPEPRTLPDEPRTLPEEPPPSPPDEPPPSPPDKSDLSVFVSLRSRARACACSGLALPGCFTLAGLHGLEVMVAGCFLRYVHV